jgi:hypothetical protein
MIKIGQNPIHNSGLLQMPIQERHEMQKIEIRIKGQINEQWSEWFGGLTISHSDPDETLLVGIVADQAALYGSISRLRDLGLQLTSVSSEEIKEDSHEQNEYPKR